MEYVVLTEREDNKRLIRDRLAVKGNKVRHFQVEQRNGLLFMRSKTRVFSPTSQ